MPPSPPMVGLPDLVEVPADLSAKAKEISGLPERLISFLRLEVAREEERKRRYSPEALDLVARAKARAEINEADGESREAALDRFRENYREVVSNQH